MDEKQIIAKYKDKFDRLNARVYTHNPNEEMLLLKWWMELHETGDINRLLRSSAHTVEGFFKIFAYPVTLIYSLDKEGKIDNATWITPDDEKSTHRTAYTGSWTAPKTRGKLKQHRFMSLSYNLAFEFFHTILGLTWQPKLLEIHTKLGYDIVGCIPNYWDKDFIYIMHLTKEKFDNSEFNNIGR